MILLPFTDNKQVFKCCTFAFDGVFFSTVGSFFGYVKDLRTLSTTENSINSKNPNVVHD